MLHSVKARATAPPPSSPCPPRPRQAPVAPVQLRARVRQPRAQTHQQLHTALQRHVRVRRQNPRLPHETPTRHGVHQHVGQAPPQLRRSVYRKVQPTRVPRDSVVAQRVNRRCVPRRVQQYTVVFIAFVVCTFAGNGDASTHSRPHQHISFDTVRHHLAPCICAHGGRIYRAVRFRDEIPWVALDRYQLYT